MRAPLVIGNWKMYAGKPAEARELAQAVRDGWKRPRGVEIGVCPPFTALAAVAEALAGSPLLLGAQNCHWEDTGPFTGEVAPPMLAAGPSFWTPTVHQSYFAGPAEPRSAPTNNKRLPSGLQTGHPVFLISGAILRRRRSRRDSTSMIVSPDCSITA